MTCIVGIEHADGVTIGGDSAGVCDFSLTIRADEKVFRNGPFLFGFTDSFRMGQLLRYGMKAPVPPMRGLDRFMATTFIDAVRKALKDGGHATTENGQESGGTFLVGVQGRLYTIWDDYQIARARIRSDAIGIGAEAARGSLHTSAGFGFPPQRRVRMALSAAADLNAAVSGPFVVRNVAKPHGGI